MIEIQIEGKKTKSISKSGEDYSAVQVTCGTNILEFPLTLDTDVIVNITFVPRPETDLGLQTKKREAEEREIVETSMNQEALDALDVEQEAALPPTPEDEEYVQDEDFNLETKEDEEEQEPEESEG